MDFAQRSVVRPVRLRIGSAAAPAELSFAFNVSDETLVLAGPACLAVGEVVFVEVGDGAIQAYGWVESETSAGHKRVRLDYVWAPEHGAFERWRRGEPVSDRRAA